MTLFYQIECARCEFLEKGLGREKYLFLGRKEWDLLEKWIRRDATYGEVVQEVSFTDEKELAFRGMEVLGVDRKSFVLVA